MQSGNSTRYELEIEQFRGPLDKLIELIEAKELEITRVNLAEVTADFLSYLDKLERKVSHGELADFVVVAARLILIKSHALLPHLKLSEEEEQDIAELEERLRLYKQVREAEKGVQELWGKHISYNRALLATIPPGFYLTQKVSPKDLLGHIQGIASELEQIQRLETEEVEMVNLEEKIGELMNRLRGIVEVNFSEVSKDRNKPEVVVMFLALLHLLRDSSVEVAQEELFGEIKISGANG